VRTLVWAITAVLISGLIVAEFAMALTADQRQLYFVFTAMAGVTFLAAWMSLKMTGRFKLVVPVCR
jgi:hypothetical protein